MMHVITGGSGSGKSAYAEMWLTGKPEKSEEKKAICPYLYIATMRPFGAETQKKIERHRQRDERNKEELKKLGWRVMTVWECQLKPAVRRQTLLENEYHINHTYLERFSPKSAKPYVIGEEKEAPGMVAEERVEYRK